MELELVGQTSVLCNYMATLTPVLSETPYDVRRLIIGSVYSDKLVSFKGVIRPMLRMILFLSFKLPTFSIFYTDMQTKLQYN